MVNVRQSVTCSQCGNSIVRVIFNYGKNRPITEFFCDNACKGAWQRAQREALGYTKEWLEEQYVTLHRSTNDIAREIGRDSKRVWEWIRDYGIPIRPRGTDYGQCFQPGVTLRKGMKLTDEHKEKIRQARYRDGRIPALIEGVHWLKVTGRKPATWKGGISPERQSFYASPEWKEAVKAVWARDNAICQRCGKHHNTAERRGTFHIHHIVSFEVKELRASPSNLVLLCRPCHLWVHSKNNADGLFIREVER